MPTLYIGHAQTAKPMIPRPVSTDYLTFFQEYDPPRVAAAIPGKVKTITNADGTQSTYTDKDYKKHFELWGAIGGEMRPNSCHGNSNTLGRDLLPLDFDNIPDEGAFLDHINNTLGSVKLGFVLYKTFSYRKDNIRYRLLVPLDRMITKQEEFATIMLVLAKILHTEIDEASTRWGQIFFIPTQTEYNADDLIRVVPGPPLVVDSWLKTIIATPQLVSLKKKLVVKPKISYTPPLHETGVGIALDRITSGKAIAFDLKTVGRFFRNIGMTHGEIERWYRYFEGMQPQPLRKRHGNVNDDTIDRPERRHRWAVMFRDIIDGLAEKDGRNETMFMFASFLLDERVQAETLLRLTVDANQRNRPPMGKEFATTVQSALKRKEREAKREYSFDF